MNILVIGRGWVGSKVYKEMLNRNHSVTLCSHDAVEHLLTTKSFDWVINCAGVTGTPNVDACELDKLHTIIGNAYFPLHVSELCTRFHTRMAHFSSGCIYEGDISEVDTPANFFGSTYSIGKAISDIALKDKAQVYRIRMPFSGENHPKNYLVKVMKYAKNGKLFEGGKNSLTHIDEAVSVACNLIERNEPNGRYNLVNRGAVTMHEVAEMMNVLPQWFSLDEFKEATKCGRSNCTIPAYHEMSDINTTLIQSIKTLS